MTDHTSPEQATRDAEATEARKGPDGGRSATPEEASAADGNRLDPAVAVSEQEMNERGAKQQGEGRTP